MPNNDNPQPTTPGKPFQTRVVNWLMECFSMEVCRDRQERNHRFLEEALELVQSLECTRPEAHQLVDYVFDRPAGNPQQELGGVMLTVAALCFPNDMDMQEAAEIELNRVWAKIDVIRKKQATKPKNSPLPTLPTTPGMEEGRVVTIPTIDERATDEDWMELLPAAALQEPSFLKHATTMARKYIASLAAVEAERDAANARYEAMSTNRNHFCKYINLIAKEFGTDKDNSAPEAVLRWVQNALDSNRKLTAEVAELREALQPVDFEICEKISRDLDDSWSDDFHNELTISIGECKKIQNIMKPLRKV